MHPRLHSDLWSVSDSETHPIVQTEDTAIKFLEDIGVIPSRDATPPTCCGLSMRVVSRGDSKLGWRWRCSSALGIKHKEGKVCYNSISPLTGTFFEASKMPIRDILSIVFKFADNQKVTKCIKSLNFTRQKRGDKKISAGTIVDYYRYLREIAEVISSHNRLPLGGEGKTVQIDETFLTNRKYNRGRITSQMTMTVLGLYCKEDKTGLFFHVKSKSKKDLWPYIHKYVNGKTSKLCTDGGKQYFGVDKMFSPNTVHLVTDHSKGEFVSKIDPSNTINDLENQNRLLKQEIISRRTTKLVHQYMALYF